MPEIVVYNFCAALTKMTKHPEKTDKRYFHHTDLNQRVYVFKPVASTMEKIKRKAEGLITLYVIIYDHVIIMSLIQQYTPWKGTEKRIWSSCC